MHTNIRGSDELEINHAQSINMTLGSTMNGHSAQNELSARRYVHMCIRMYVNGQIRKQ
jgi:hypothetical protein